MFFRRLMFATLAVGVALGLAGLGSAAELQVAPQVQPVKPGASGPARPAAAPSRCPTGWHVKPGSTDDAYSCLPNKPASFKCPAGFQLLEEGECGFGCRKLPR